MLIYEEDKLIERLKEHLEWAQANEWETPITLSDDIEMAIKLLEQYAKLTSNATDVMRMLAEQLQDTHEKYQTAMKEIKDLRNSSTLF